MRSKGKAALDFQHVTLALSGQLSPVLEKHSKNFALEDSLSIGVDRDAAELQDDAAAGGKLASTTAVHGSGEIEDLPGVKSKTALRHLIG